MKATMYLHSDKGSNWDLGERLGLKGEALAMFRHALCEVVCDVKIDEATGITTLVKVDGNKVREGDGSKFDFGDYCMIEQKRFGAPNEFYLYKVIGRGHECNAYVDVPVQSPETETIHPEGVPVLNCICCGVQEKQSHYFRESDVKDVK